MRWENHYLRLFLYITKTITSARTTGDVLNLIVSRIPEVVGKESKAFWWLPFPSGGEVGGLLRLLSRTKREFNQLEIDFVAALAEQCGICIENSQYYDQQQRQLKYFKTVCEISKNIGEKRQLDSILDFIVKTMPDVMDVKACTIRFIESSKGKLELKAAFGLTGSLPASRSAGWWDRFFIGR